MSKDKEEYKNYFKEIDFSKYSSIHIGPKA